MAMNGKNEQASQTYKDSIFVLEFKISTFDI